jgi:LysR family transcriptional regulator (chromosome initiation inhibitor)
MITFAPEHLVTLRALVDEGTFEAAAQRLHMTQSAVSQRIKQLERTAGQVLVQRTTPVVTTAAGDVVLRYARQVQLLADDAAVELGADGAGAGGPGGAGRLGTSIAVAVNADSLATWFLEALAALPPEVGAVFDLHREDQENTTSLLRSGTVLAAVTSTREPLQGCSSEPLGLMRYRAVASPGFVDRWLGGVPTMGRVDAAPMLDFDRSDQLQRGFLRASLGYDPRPPRTFVPSSADFARAARLGLGWGLLPEAQCLGLLADGSLVELAPGEHVDLALYWQRWALSSRLLDTLTESVRRSAAEVLLPA